MVGLLLFRSAPALLLQMEINTSVRLGVNRSAALKRGRATPVYRAGADQLTPITKGEKAMNDQNRVLLRRGARALSEQEVELVNGGIRTATLCTASATGGADGDTFMSECGADV